MKIVACLGLLAVLATAAFAQTPEQEIRAKTKKFTEAIVSKNLAILDDVFEKDPTDIYYDINEGPLVGFDRLKRVWTAATTNFTISKFDFADDMKIWVSGNDAVQVGSWMQVQENRSGQSREIKGRATVLWRKREGAWKVWHYHASITPPRPARPPQ